MPKKIFIDIVKIIALWTAGLYLLGFIWFPFFGVGNYALIRVDALLPSEWVIISILAISLILWSLKTFYQLTKMLPSIPYKPMNIYRFKAPLQRLTISFLYALLCNE